MKFDEIKERLAAEGISVVDFVREHYPADSIGLVVGRQSLPWLGSLKVVSYHYAPETEDELENEQIVYHVLDHDLHIRVAGVYENEQWDYYDFYAVRPQTSTTTRTETYYTPLPPTT